MCCRSELSKAVGVRRLFEIAIGEKTVTSYSYGYIAANLSG